MLNESDRNYLVTEIENKYLPKKDELKDIFLMNETIFGNNFYIQLEDKYDNFRTRTIYLVNELIETGKLNNFLKIVRKKYSLFADKINIPQLELIQILNANFEDNREILLTGYQLSMSKRKIVAIESPTTATELISRLTIPKEEQQTHSYIEKFVGYLLEEKLNLSLSLKTSLKKWAEKNINNYDKLLELLIQEKKEGEQQNSFLIVKISSKGRSYIMNAWEMIDPYKHGKNYSTCNQVTIQKKDRVTAEIIIKKDLSNFSKEIKQFIDQRKCTNLKQIQIFLPNSLMHYTVDCAVLDLGLGKLESTIGTEYEVIIRCLERLELPDNNALKNKWLKKGEIFQQILELEKPAADTFLSSEDKAGYATFDLRLSHDDELIAVYFTNVIQVEQLKNVVSGGIPLALWIRKQPSNHNQITIAQQLKNFLTATNERNLLKDLPYQVKRERGKGNNISNHLCLLWDDPNLLPPKQDLTDTKI